MTWTCPGCGRTHSEPDTTIIRRTGEAKLTCPDCGRSEVVAQHTAPVADGLDAVEHYSWKQVYRACGVRGWRP